MGAYVAEQTVKCMNKKGVIVKDAKILLLGITFKENCPDIRNTKVFDIIQELREYGIEPVVADPEADAEEALRFYGIKLTPVDEIRDMDAVVLAVAHEAYKSYTMEDMDKLLNADKKILFDVKGLFDRKAYEKAGYSYWRL